MKKNKKIVKKDEDNRDDSNEIEIIEIQGEVQLYRDGDYLVISNKKRIVELI